MPANRFSFQFLGRFSPKLSPSPQTREFIVCQSDAIIAPYGSLERYQEISLRVVLCEGREINLRST